MKREGRESGGRKKEPESQMERQRKGDVSKGNIPGASSSWEEVENKAAHSIPMYNQVIKAHLFSF